VGVDILLAVCYLLLEIEKVTDMFNVNDNMLDSCGNHYVILAERFIKNQNTHSQRLSINQYQCHNIGREKIRWIDEAIIKEMIDEGKLIVV
jgi:hypothetical protein